MTTPFLACVLGAAVGLAVPMAAQQAGSGGNKTPTKVQAKSVTITGCVAQGIDADHYVLANAVRSKEPASSTAIAGRSKTVGSDQQGAPDRTGPYDLVGGEFKAHLGHTVEVQGTGGSDGPAPASSTGASSTERKSLPTFNVQSVKMVSKMCS